LFCCCRVFVILFIILGRGEASISTPVEAMLILTYFTLSVKIVSDYLHDILIILKVLLYLAWQCKFILLKRSTGSILIKFKVKKITPNKHIQCTYINISKAPKDTHLEDFLNILLKNQDLR